jgi:hypothetical protein
VSGLLVDGRRIEGTIVPPAAEGAEVRVEAEIEG